MRIIITLILFVLFVFKIYSQNPCIDEKRKTFKDFKDSLENGITIEVMFGTYIQKADSVPQILKEIFPSVYFYECEHDSGHGLYKSYGAFYNKEHYDQFNFNDFIAETIGNNNISKEQQIRTFCAFYIYDKNFKISNINYSKRQFENVDFDYLVNIKYPNGIMTLIFAFRNEGELFQVRNISNNKNVLYKHFQFVNQY